jgi:hypothetical protein
MEKHFLADFVSGKSRFVSEPWYNPNGDCIIYKTVDEAVVADRIDGVLTVFRSAIDNRPIGYKIKDVKAIINQFGLDGLLVRHKQTGGKIINAISIAAILLAAYETGPQTIERRRAYSGVFESPVGPQRIPAEQLEQLV